MSTTLKQRIASVPPLVWLLLLTAVCLVPFAGKAFFIDDTLFLRAAQQIQKHPMDFYGFNINWFGYVTPMSVAFDNPPLTSYYIALVTTMIGWSEWGLHLAFLLPALAAIWGIYTLAQNYCRHPFIASSVVVLTPVFLISATSVMCDVTLLAFWVWTLVFFEKGLRDNNLTAFLICGCLGGLAVWTKFIGLGLIPLLIVYGLVKTRHAGRWMVAPIVSLLFMGAYGGITYRLYGQDLLFSAASYASDFRAHSYDKLWEKIILGLGFVGGCFLSALFYIPLLWSRKVFFMGPCLLAAGLLFIPRMTSLAWLMWNQNGDLNWMFFLQVAVLTIAGLYILLLVVADLWERRDAVSLLLLMWISGILIFTIGLNWVINGRSLLPAVPVVGILVARRLEQRNVIFLHKKVGWFMWPALPAAVISLLLVTADYNLANAHRTAAKTLYAEYQRPGRTLWFQAHWGFQYYMEQLGGKALAARSPQYNAGDIVILHFDGFGNPHKMVQLPTDGQVRLIQVDKYVANTFCATVNTSAGAGFYAANLGPLPFVVGRIKPEYFNVYQVPPTTAPAKKDLSLKD